MTRFSLFPGRHRSELARVKKTQVLPRSALVGDVSTLQGTIDLSTLESGGLASDQAKTSAKGWCDSPFFEGDSAALQDKQGKKRGSSPHRATLRPKAWPIVLAFVDYFQILGILWRMQNRWEMPRFWLKLSCPFLIFNLDGWTFLNYFFAFPELSFPLYWIAWLVITCAILSIWVMIAVYFYPLGARRELECRVLALGDLCIAPALIMLCDAIREGRSYLGLPTILAAIFAVHWQFKHSSSLILSENKEKQERYYLQKEVEWLLHINQEWAVDHFRVVTLFVHGAQHMRVFLGIWKLCLVILSETLIDSPSHLAVLLSVIACCVGILTITRRIYRLRYAHQASCTFSWVIFLNFYLSSLSAAGVRSSLAVVSVQTPLLIALNAGGIGAALFIVPFASKCTSKLSGQLFTPSARILAWQLCQHEQGRMWISEVHAARKALSKFRFLPSKLYPVHDVYLRCQRLKTMLARAEDANSVFANTIAECLDVMYAAIAVNRGKSVYPHIPLEKAMPHLTKHANLADQELALMNPTKRRILNKLRSFALWTGRVQGQIEISAASAAIEWRRLFASANTALSVKNPDPGLLQRLRRQITQLDIHEEAEKQKEIVKAIDKILVSQFLIPKASARSNISSS